MLFLQLFLYAAVASAACRRQGQKIVLDKGAAQRQTTSSSTSTTMNPIAAASTPGSSSPSSSLDSADSYSPSGGGYSASFTQYGGCKDTSVACGTLPGGYTAAASQNLFGAGPGDGPGPGCGKCWSLSSSAPGTKSIKVTINNLCPAIGNEAMCAQNGLGGKNSVGMNVNFDLCMDNGSADAFFGTAASRMATGTATEVPC